MRAKANAKALTHIYVNTRTYGPGDAWGLWLHVMAFYHWDIFFLSSFDKSTIILNFKILNLMNFIDF